MCGSSTFRSLFDTAQMIALQPPLPGDRKAIARCMQCIDDFYYQSRITTEEWETLKDILLRAFP